jgi:flagellar hook-length control protein FliK
MTTATSRAGDLLAVAAGRNPLPAAPPAHHGSDPPDAPPGAPFATVLDDHQARTAVAEGHERAERRSADPSSPATTEAAALLGGVPLPAGVAVVAARAPPSAPVVAPAAKSSAPAPVAVALPTQPAAPAAAGPAALALPNGKAVPAAASKLPLAPSAAAPATAAEERTASTAPPAPSAPPALPTAAAKLAAARSAAPSAAPGRPAPAAAQAAPARAHGTPRAPAVASGGSAARPAATPPSAAPAAAPASAAAPAAPTADVQEPRGVGLEHAVETVRLALHAAAERGVARARISLTPRELGGIEVHLRQTADGLVARVVAEHATAAQLLQHAGGELRRSLEAQGVNVLRLDIGASGEQGGRMRERRAQTAAGSRPAPGVDDPLDPLDGAADAASTTTTLALPNGAVVDVLA